MARRDRLIRSILRGDSDANISFSQLCALLREFGFQERIRGSHHIFVMSGVDEILNLQPVGAKSKPYQVKQVRNVLVKYKLVGDENGERQV